MTQRLMAALVAASMLALGTVPARAANPMGYQLITDRQAANLPRGHGALGLVVNVSSMISDSGMNFALLRVDQVKPGSAGAAAGIQVGDQIIAVDGRVFPDIKAFAEYAGALRPGSVTLVDYIPKGGAAKDAQRLGITVGKPGGNSQPTLDAHQGMSTGTKVAIGLGAAALLGYYELHKNSGAPVQQQQQQPQQGFIQQR